MADDPQAARTFGGGEGRMVLPLKAAAAALRGEVGAGLRSLAMARKHAGVLQVRQSASMLVANIPRILTCLDCSRLVLLAVAVRRGGGGEGG